MISLLSIVRYPAGQCRRELGIDKKTYSGKVNHSMIALFYGILECGIDIGIFEIGVMLKDLVPGGTQGQKVEDIGDPDPESPNTGTSPTLVGINGYALQFTHNGIPVAFSVLLASLPEGLSIQRQHIVCRY